MVCFTPGPYWQMSCKNNTPQLVKPASMDPRRIAVSLTVFGPNTLQCRR
jgi:hypothetical protein